MIYKKITEAALQGKKQLALLIDPDRPDLKRLAETSVMAQSAGVDLFFLGGSLLTADRLEQCIDVLKSNCDIPVVLFPGSTMQINRHADAILFLSLISGRNAEMLIGKHVIAAPYIKEAGLEVIPTGYMMIDSGKPTAALYMSNSHPIPADKNDIASCTAMAGEMLGLKMIYLEAGSGALQPVPLAMIQSVKQSTNLPLIVGGGIRDVKTAAAISNAGADILVVGTAVEENQKLIEELVDCIKVDRLL